MSSMTIDAPNELLWYVAHTYSGYENKVKVNLEKAVENNGLQDLVREITVPVEEVEEIKNGKRHLVSHKIYPGYVLVRMIMTDESWSVVRNTRGVTGFVGPGSKPIPLTEEEVAGMLSGGHLQKSKLSFDVGDTVKILSGLLEEFSGAIESIDMLHKKVRVVVSMFGRNTPIELEFDQIAHDK
ncbi:MAG: transcription termination/antitermination protein NusG [Oscillospiraceae bacterium]|jgi:transcriptional antiterminator NusG|nr:transcription termination/antitermination protein NusG [Oscillospiraceae bacterium]